MTPGWPYLEKLFGRLVAAVRVRAPSSPQPDTTLSAVTDHAAELTDFGKRSDVAYTEIAKGVSLLSKRIRELATKTALLRDVLTDQDEDKALLLAYGVYKGSVDLVHASMGVALADHDWLEKVELRLLHACEARRSLEKYSLIFRTVTVETKIEATRLEHAERMVFETVAGAIQTMERKITETASSAFARIEDVVKETQAERSRLKSHQLLLHQEAQTSVATIRRELDTLREALEPCVRESEHISGLVERVTGALQKVVGALQAQDIVRQQLEHVVEGLHDIEKHQDDAPLMLQAARVQAAQIKAAWKRISEAGAVLESGLRELGAHSAELLSHFLEMENAAEKAFEDCRLASLFQIETTKLSNVAQESERSNQRIAELVQRVDSVIHAFSDEVGGHEFDVKLVALNAQVAAAQISRAGGLNRLAEETSRVAGEVADMTADMTGELREALGTLRAMKKDADDFQVIICRDKGDLETRSVSVNEKLQRLQGQIEHEAKQVAEAFTDVNATIGTLMERFHPEAEIEASLGPVAAFCESLIAKLSENPQTLEKAAAYDVGSKRYTMEEEYQTHRDSLGAEGDASASTAPEKKAEDIELF